MSWDTGVDGFSLLSGRIPWPTAASLESSAMTNDVGLHSGGIGHGGGGAAGVAPVGGDDALALADAPLTALADEPDALDAFAVWPGSPGDEETPASGGGGFPGDPGTVPRQAKPAAGFSAGVVVDVEPSLAGAGGSVR